MSVLTGCGIFSPSVPSSTPPPPKEEPIEPKAEEAPAKEVEAKVNNIALLLPFHFDLIQSGVPSRSDVNRAEIPLDFYQGFKLALDQLAAEGNNFQLEVLDTRDNVAETSRLATRPSVQSADLIVGPIFPKEIPAFASAAKLGYSIQVSPLAATDPSSFDIENLVTLATPILQHAHAMAEYVAKQTRPSDQVIFYMTNDTESTRYLVPFMEKLKSSGRVQAVAVTSLAELEAQLSLAGKNIVVAASLNKYLVDALMVDLLTQSEQYGFKIELIGHPNWVKSKFVEENLRQLNTLIPASYFVDPSSNAVKRFVKEYREQYTLEPSEFAYKGFDTGYYFGSLLIKYGPNFPKHLLEEKYKGLQTNYNFELLPRAGYVNTYIRLLKFNGTHYVPR